jgi:hypothetical protein
MTRSAIKRFVDVVRAGGLPKRRMAGCGLSKPWVYVCEAAPPVQWDRQSIESALAVRLPRQVIDLWTEAGGVKLYVEKNNGQWGLVVWSGTEVVPGNRRYKRIYRSDDFRPGDLLIGEFRGDSDLVLLRCDEAANDYGRVVIIDPLERREAWKIAANSLGGFLRKWCKTKGEKYWEYHWKVREAARRKKKMRKSRTRRDAAE